MSRSLLILAVGSLTVRANGEYAAQYMEAVFKPETCLQTPVRGQL